MNLAFRQATQNDLPGLVDMLADDPLGAQREDTATPLNPAYLNAFAQLDADPNNELIVVECTAPGITHAGASLVGMLQLTFIPYLTHTGSWRCLIEGVRIHQYFRGQGLGKQLFQWAIARARAKNCRLIQLTSDKQRPDAIRFYQSLGFSASHEGMKLHL